MCCISLIAYIQGLWTIFKFDLVFFPRLGYVPNAADKRGDGGKICFQYTNSKKLLSAGL